MNGLSLRDSRRIIEKRRKKTGTSL
ncbi:MAG: hypothetical protein SCABRO_02244, partial [Candidatus Scalindua brodae]